ncbi:MAG: hypothetical protein COW29_05440 [Rhodobacterales bacterium CG15_BIG_FIL_POST_REV_8_21_14_020_59_13]|nr:MAG: hypothetical protein COW29_05440 [Rhodobacterales bacterium CG15_BIG_FIL_POST_REV_8_21_14_020_59_13]
MEIYGISIIAVLLATLSFMIVGFLWYGPLFGKRWMALNGFTEKSMKDTNMAVVMGKGITNSLVAAIGMGLVLNWKGAEGLLASMKTAFLVWLFFSATTALLAHIYEKQKLKLTLIHFGNQLAAYLLAGAIFSFF